MLNKQIRDLIANVGRSHSSNERFKLNGIIVESLLLVKVELIMILMAARADPFLVINLISNKR